MAQYEEYTVAYENNRGNKIVLTELPYAINIEPLLDYEWAYASRDRRRGSRVAGFNKAVASEALTVHVLGKTLRERNEAIDAFNNVIEVDIYDGVAGKIWFNDWYTYGYITSAKNSSWQYGIAVAKKEISFVREEETWFHEILKTSYSEIEEEETEYEEGIKDYEVSPYIHEVTETPDTTPYLFRPSPALEEDYDTLLLDTVVGGTLAVNQLVQNGNFADGTNNWAGQYCSITASGGILTATTTVANQAVRIEQSIVPFTQGHKYFFTETVKTSMARQVRLAYRYTGGVKYEETLNTQANVWGELSTVMSAVTVTEGLLYLYYSQGAVPSVGDTAQYKNIMCIDLTQMFGSTIADYVYNLEQSTAGSGVAWLKQYYPSIFNSYQPYNAGTLESVEASAHVMTGFNQWDEEWEVGGIDNATGANFNASDRIRAKNYCPCIGGETYYSKCTGTHLIIYWYDTSKTYIGYVGASNTTVTAPQNACYFKICTTDETTYNDDICINISSDRNGEYEAYTQTSYPLDSSLTLRGIPKLDNGVPYYDGDEYKSDGTVTRKYGVVDLGSLDYAQSGTAQTGAYRFGTTAEVAGIKYASSNSDIVQTKSVLGPAVSMSNTYNNIEGVSVSTTGKVSVYKDAYKTMSAADFKTAMSGVYLVYELATPTTETADTYDRVQECYKGGTEEFVSSTVIPVGHETKYELANLIGYDYAYDYGVDRQSMTNIVNPNPLGCNWRISISGPVVNPYVRIGETVVNVNVEVPDGAFLVVDSSAKDIMLTLADGTEINAFGARNPDYYIFALIDSGVNPIIWDGSFNWQLQMIEERSEPRWLMA